MESRASRLHAAGEIHRFHRDVGELVSRAADKRAALAAPPLPRDLRAATSLLREHETTQNDLLAIDAQMQVSKSNFTDIFTQCGGTGVTSLPHKGRILRPG